MKRLHRHDLFGWTVFDQARNIDFHGLVWVRDEGNVLVDPVAMSAHDRAHLVDGLGGAAFIVVTNSDHIRDSAELAEQLGATIVGPRAERETFAARCDRWVGDGDVIVPGLVAYELKGSKTPGELALLLEDTTLITGDLVRAHEGGRLCMLPDAKLADRAAAVASVKRLAALPGIEAVLTGDGWPVFRDGGARLRELADSVEAPAPRADLAENLVWLDMEMTGLDVNTCVPIEVAIIVTGPDLDERGTMSAVIHQPPEALAHMGDFVRKMHTTNGLLERVAAATDSIEVVEDAMIAAVKPLVIASRAVLAGNSIHADRRFIDRYFPRFAKLLHYRMVDVSSTKELVRRWYGEAALFAKADSDHTALADIRSSVAELEFYRRTLMR